jgi:putative nucleotidyltransferase with HDIG domain/PAS domain S-box-containing protein
MEGRLVKMERGQCRPVPSTLLTLVFVLTAAAAMWFAISMYRLSRVTEDAQQQDMQTRELMWELRRLDDLMAMTASEAAQTGDAGSTARGLQLEARFVAAMNRAADMAFAAGADDAAARMRGAGWRRLQMEREAFGLVREGRLAEAKAILSGAEYGEQAKAFAAAVRQLDERCRQRLEDSMLSTQRNAATLTTMAAVVFVLSLVSWLVAVNALRRSHARLLAESDARKEALDALRESEERYRGLYEAMAEGVVYESANGRVVSANAAALTMLGMSEEALKGASADGILWQAVREDGTPLPPEERPAAVAFRTGRLSRSTIGFIHPRTQQRVWVDASAVPQFKPGRDKPEGVFTTFSDVTERRRLLKELEGSFGRLQVAFEATVKSLVSAIELRDPYTAGHQKRVAELAVAIALQMGFTEKDVGGLRMAAIIHDIGKIHVPAEILTLPRKLTDAELALVKTHAEAGYHIARSAESPWPVAEAIYQHHERSDGSGYPRGLRGDDILMEARILAVADVIEAMASHRPYRAALGVEAALKEVEAGKGVKYDAAVVDACLAVFRDGRFTLEA